MNVIFRSGWAVKWGLAGVAFLLLCWLMFMAVDRRGRVDLPGWNGSTVEYSRESYGAVEKAAMPSASGWREWDGGGYLRAGRGETLWLRVTLVNPTDNRISGILGDGAFYLDQALCYIPGRSADEQPWRMLRSGEWAPPEEKAIWGRETAFPVEIPPHGRQVVYLELRDHLEICMRPVWWPDQSNFQSFRLRQAMAEGVYFGALLGLLLYNAALWTGARFAGIGSYLLRMACFFGCILVARGELLVIGVPLGSPWMESLTTALLALGGWFLLRFAAVFVSLPDGAWVVRAATLWAGRVLLVLAVASLATRWVPWSLWLPFVFTAVVGVHFILPWIAVVSVRSGRSLGGYQLLAAGLLFGGLLPLCTAVLPLVSLESGGVVVMAGSLLEMMLVSLLIAARYSGVQKEKIRAQAQLLEEAEQRKAIQEAYVDDLALEVEDRTKELRATLDDKDRMLALLGHDLRSPLTGLTRRAEQLSATADGAEMERFTREVASMGGRLLLLIEDLVLWGKLKAGSVHRSPFPVKALVEPVLSLHAGMVAERGITLEVDLSSSAVLHTDVVLGQTLLRNILSNAIKFARGRVMVSVRETGEGVRISVMDDGPGLPDIPFENLNQSGLGLHLCREIAGALGTKLEAGSLPAGGTVISFVLATRETSD